MPIYKIDERVIHWFRRVADPLARLGLFIVYFWFGALKVFGASPATPLVQSLFEHTISFMQFETFIVLFGLFEMLIGVLFIFKGYERIVMPLLLLHMITTAMPLFVIPEATWSGFLVPTLEGQYIVKNIMLIAAATGIAAHLHPLHKREG